jgi:predicted ATP-dependent endonuclease of OLD family
MGAIREGEIEIKPLTVFIGPNNSGKTWAAYGISSIFSPFSWNIYTEAYIKGSLEEKYLEIEQLMETLIDKKSASIDIVKFFEDNWDSYFNNLAKFSSSWMSKFLATNTVSFENSSITIDVKDKIKHAMDTLVCRSIDTKIPFDKDKDKELILRVYKEKKESSIFFEISDKINEKLSKAIRYSIHALIFRYMNQALYPNVRYLPAERTGFVVLLASGIKEKIKNEEKKDVIVEENSSDSDNIEFLMPYPIQNMFKLLYIIKEPGRMNETFKKRMEDKKLKKLFDLATVFETKVMGGKLEYEEGTTNKGISNLYYRFQEKADLPLEMSVVSSTIKDLTPLSIYLKCFLNSDELLVIDEPEMNLHPANQARFMEFLVMLVNSGINIMITTHSPYMTNHLESLIKAYNSKKSGLESLFYLGSRDAFISKENVSVYYFGKEGIESILKEDGDIDLDSFSEVSRDISEIYYEIE